MSAVARRRLAWRAVHAPDALVGADGGAALVRMLGMILAALAVEMVVEGSVRLGYTALQWHAVQVTHDSISGVPYHLSIACDSCRRAVSRATVDSVRFGDPVGGFWRSVIMFGVVPLVACLWIFRDLGS